MPDNRTTKKMIADVRKAPHSDDVALLCVRTEELLKMCVRLESALHEAAKEVEENREEIARLKGAKS